MEDKKKDPWQILDFKPFEKIIVNNPAPGEPKVYEIQRTGTSTVITKKYSL